MKANSPPLWISVPSPSVVTLVGGVYDLAQHVTDANSDTLTFSLNASSTALPLGVSIDGSTLLDTGLAGVGVTTGIIIDVTDGRSEKVASASFSYTVTLF